MKKHRKLHLLSSIPYLIALTGAFLALRTFAQVAASNYAVSERGPDYRVWQRSVSTTNTGTGQVTQQTEAYRELGNGICYQMGDGTWADSQDLIELTPTGAQAVRGPMKASFNADNTSIGAITLSTPSGDLFQSHVIGLFYADSASGKVARIGSCQFGQGTVYPPNVLVYSNVLSGLNADLMLVWAQNGFEQNLVLKQSPPRPEAFGLSSASTTLQLWTALDSCPVPREQRLAPLGSGLVDHLLIFADTIFPVGSAFAFGSLPIPPPGQAAPVRLVSPSTPGFVPVAKSLESIAGHTVLIEAVKYADLAAFLSALPQAALMPAGPRAVEYAARGRLLEKTANPAKPSKLISLASARYAAEGLVLDYVTLGGGTNGYTFTSGTTYFISSSFITGAGTVNFQNNAVLKFNPNTYLLTYGPVSFSYSGQPVVFTSKDDNSYGQIINGSTSQPGYSASQELWLYYETIQTTVQNALFRWAQRAIQYDENTVQNYPTLSYCAFQDCQTGVYANLGYNDTLTLTGDTCCNVATPLQEKSSNVSGSITTDCGVVSVAMVNDPSQDSLQSDPNGDPNKNSQSESSFVVLPDGSTIVSAFVDTHLSQYGTGAFDLPGSAGFFNIPAPRQVGWAKSVNSGATFSDLGPIPPFSRYTTPDADHGDAGDPVLTYTPSGGPNGTIYLLVNPSRNPNHENGPRLWTSTDKGSTFSPVNMDVPGGLTHADKPMIKANGTDLFAAGAYNGAGGIWASHSSNGGGPGTWDPYHTLDTSGPSTGADIAIAQDGTAYFVWLQGSGTYPGPFQNKLRYAWVTLSGGIWTWSDSRDLGISLTSTQAIADAQLLRSNAADQNDFFTSFCLPRVAIANNRIYVVYSDLTPNWPTSHDRGDIWLAEAAINADHSLVTPASKRKVNNDATTTDQWNPSIAVNPAGTELFIGYYSRQNDPNNSNIMAYGAKANIASGLAAATFDCIPISPTQFPPLFAGTSAPAEGGWAYDPVFPQVGVCLDQYANYVGANSDPSCATSVLTTFATYINFCADDYTWASADSSYFYFSWCDRTRTFVTPLGSRPDADVKLAKIEQ